MPKEADLVLAHIAVDQKFITQDQLSDILGEVIYAEGEHREISITGLMLERDYLTRGQLDTLRELLQERGEALVEGYTVEAILGRGAMGCVYLARQLSMDRPVALKVLPPAWGKDRVWIDRFLREARSTARLNHVNIVQGYDVGMSNGMHYFAMEYVEGKTLRELLTERGPLDEQLVARVILMVSSALAHAWEFGIVHRDIKPDNIMMTPAGVAKLTDMGLAKRMRGDGNVTRVGAIVGTPNYISPEQARGAEDIDIRSDIYSLGITMYQLLTGELPFRDINPTVVMTRHITERVPSPRILRPELSQGLAKILELMTEKDVKQRYQHPSHVVADLEAYLDGRLEIGGDPGTVETSAPVPGAGVTAPGNDLPTEFRFCYVPQEEEAYFAQIAVKNGLITAEQVQGALELQEARAEVGAVAAIDEILVERRYITQRHRERIWEVQNSHRGREAAALFGRVSVKMGLATKEQIDECLRIQEKLKSKGENRKLGDILMAKGYLGFSEKIRILTEQVRARQARDNKLFGGIALKSGFVTRYQLEEALQAQDKVIAVRQEAPLLGEVLAQLGYLTDAQARVILRAQRRHEMTDHPVLDLIKEVMLDGAALAATAPKPRDGRVSGLFDNVQLKGYATDTEGCPFCGYELRGAPSRCPRCKKSLA